MSVTSIFGHVALGTATNATPATAEDAVLADMVAELMVRAAGMADGADQAARALLLAGADMMRGDIPPDRAHATSAMLLDAVQEALDAYLTPPPALPPVGRAA